MFPHKLSHKVKLTPLREMGRADFRATAARRFKRNYVFRRVWRSMRKIVCMWLIRLTIGFDGSKMAF
jgi:hypothetical protein